MSSDPCIGKLELNDNHFTEKSVGILLRLMKFQAKKIRTIQLEDRLKACFLGKVSLAGNQPPIDSKLLNDVQMVRLCVFFFFLLWAVDLKSLCCDVLIVFIVCRGLRLCECTDTHLQCMCSIYSQAICVWI